MAYSEELAARVRSALSTEQQVTERKMFGGLAFMVAGHMCCGVLEDRLMVRVGPHAYEEALRQPHARIMDFTGKPMRGMVYVDTDGVNTQKMLQKWVARGLAFVRTLPPKGAAA